ncbi:hypothetical protein CEXT_460131, partial [Caerostris extrusa]
MARRLILKPSLAAGGKETPPSRSKRKYLLISLSTPKDKSLERYRL